MKPVHKLACPWRRESKIIVYDTWQKVLPTHDVHLYWFFEQYIMRKVEAVRKCYLQDEEHSFVGGLNP